MASILLYCTRCWTGYASIGDVPVKCPACDRVTRWVTKFPTDTPMVKYALTPKDEALLHALRIDPEVVPPPVVGTVES